MEIQISRFLRIGVLVSGVLLAIGWIWLWITEGNRLEGFTVYQPKPLNKVVYEAWISSNWAVLVSVIGLGILVLLPVARVFFNGILFVKQKEKVMAWMSFGVFVALVLSFFLGIDR